MLLSASPRERPVDMSKLRTTNWDAIVTSAPLDRQASIVRDGRSAADPVTVQNSYAQQPPTRPYMDIPANNLTGQRFGRVVALGLGERARKGTTPWVVLCDCGRYAQMRAVALRSMEPDKIACGECTYIARAPDKERIVIRHEKADAAPQLECNTAMFPHLERLLGKAVADGFDTDTALRAMTQFIQREKAKAREPTVMSQACGPEDK